MDPTKYWQAKEVVDLADWSRTPAPIREALYRGDFAYAADLLAKEGREVPDWLADATPSSIGLAYAVLTGEGAPEGARDVVVCEVGGDDFVVLGTLSEAELNDDFDAADRLLADHDWELLSPWDGTASGFVAWVWKESTVYEVGEGPLPLRQWCGTVHALSLNGALEKAVAGFDPRACEADEAGDDVISETRWAVVAVRDEDGAEAETTVEIAPDIPACVGGGEHAWRREPTVANGRGGVQHEDVCATCGLRVFVDTAHVRPHDGERVRLTRVLRPKATS